MATNIKLKSSSLTGKTPTLSDLSLRELAVNTADGKLFLRKGDGSGSDKIIDVTAPLQASEPMGHENKSQSAISFNTVNRRFTIQPVSTSFNVWCKGVKYNFTTAQTVDLPNTTGIYYIYFDGDGALQYRTSYFDWENDAPTAYVYWNATTGTAPFVADERHGIVLDWQTHEYLHRTRGAVIANGFSISNYVTTGTGSDNKDAQFDLGGGTFFDEDLEVIITHSNTPTADTWEQDLQGPSQIPVFYQSGNAWVRDIPTDYALKQGTARIKYNLFSGGSWTTPDVASDTHYTTSWIIATNNINYSVISIMGQSESNKITDEEELTFGDLILDGFPVVEFRPLYKIIWQTDSGYANTPNARIAGVYDIRQLSSGGGISGTTPVSDHGLLTGLGDDDHLQYVHVSENRSITASHTISGTLTISNASNSALTVAGNVGIGTTNSTEKLHIYSSDAVSSINIDSSNSGTTTYYSLAGVRKYTTEYVPSSNFFSIGRSGVAYDLNLKDGNIGIGTNSPISKLDVRGWTFINSDSVDPNWNSQLRIDGNATYAPKIVLASTTGYRWSIRNDDPAGNGELKFRYEEGNADFVTFTRTGLVGIGTTNSGAKLELQSSYATQATNHFATFARTGGAINAVIGYNAVDIDYMYMGTGTAHPFGLRTNNTLALYIDTSQNVGIGITNPEQKLHVPGAVHINGGATGGGVNITDGTWLRLGTLNSTGSPFIGYGVRAKTGVEGANANELVSTTSIGLGRSAIIVGSSNGGVSGTFQVWTGPAESGVADGGTLTNFQQRLTVDATGNVGIGTTNPQRKLHVHAPGNDLSVIRLSGSAVLETPFDIRQGIVGLSNAGFSIYDVTATATRFAIDSAGNVGIGSDNPQFKLDVNGGLAVGNVGSQRLNISTYSSYNGELPPAAALISTPGGYPITILGDGTSGSTGGGIVLSYYTSSSWRNALEIYNTSSPVGNLLLMKSGGNVGIGTSNPVQLLDLYGSDKLIKINSFTDSSSIAIGQWDGVHNRVESVNRPLYFTTYTGSIEFGPSNSKALSITSSGNVGIGTTNPSYKLHAYGSSSVAKFQSSGNYVDINLANTTSGSGYIQYYDSNLRFFAASSNVPTMVITGGSPGNVGIGTTNPQKVLEVITPSSDYASVGVAVLAEGEWTGIHFGYRENNTAYRKSVLAFERRDSAARGKIHILNNNDNSSNNATLTDARLTIQSDGNVGIGTTNPSDKLHIVGTTLIEAQGLADKGSLTIKSADPFIRLEDSDGVSDNAKWDIRNIGASGFNLLEFRTINDANTVFNTRVVFKTDGNVGIGTTNPTDKLHIYSSTVVYNNIESSAATNAGVRLKNTLSDWYIINDSNGELQFYKGDIKLLIDSTGNVGIGTNDPQYKLEVNGSFAATTKSFIIPHPTKSNYKLRHGSLEGPENGVYVRGRSTDFIIHLPEYWTKLVDPDSITVNLTPVGDSAQPRVKQIKNNMVEVFSREEGQLNYYYIIFAERADVDSLDVEIDCSEMV